MPAALAPAIIAAAGAVAGSGMQAYASGRMNKKTREFNTQTRDLQRQWALEDWDRQNAYNSPAQQMQRLREAGLNPHLIYGGGQPSNTASNVNQTSTPDWNPKTPDIGSILTSPVNAYLETRSFQTQQALSEGQMKIQNAQILKILSETDTKNFDLEQKRTLAETQVAIQKEILTGHKLSNQMSADENARKALQNASNLKEALTRMAKTMSDMDLQQIQMTKEGENIKSIKQGQKLVEQQINNAKVEGLLKNLELSLRKKGINPNDPAYQRELLKVWDGLINGNLFEKIKGTIMDQFSKQFGGLK